MTHQSPTDWADRWLGGFCAVGALGGLAVRGPDYAAHPPFAQQLLLPPMIAGSWIACATAQAAWSDALGGQPVVLLASAAQARALLLQALGVAPHAPVGLPANATRALTEAVKHHPARPHFLDLHADLSLDADAARRAGVQVAWAQPAGGVGLPGSFAGRTLLIDASDSLPSFDPPVETHRAAATIYGLYLDADLRYAGALLVCPDATLAQAVEALAGPTARPAGALALAQLARLRGPAGIVAAQQAALAAVRRGLSEAAGLPLLATTPGVLAQHSAVCIPAPCDPATFYAYVLGENTPVHWLPAQRPLHYAALRPSGAPAVATSAAHLARVLCVPVGPGYSEEEIRHSILGITKAADYLGVRWYTDPARAAWYADQMNEWYGAEHDGYRPLF